MRRRGCRREMLERPGWAPPGGASEARGGVGEGDAVKTPVQIHRLIPVRMRTFREYLNASRSSGSTVYAVTGEGHNYPQEKAKTKTRVISWWLQRGVAFCGVQVRLGLAANIVLNSGFSGSLDFGIEDKRRVVCNSNCQK